MTLPPHTLVAVCALLAAGLVGCTANDGAQIAPANEQRPPRGDTDDADTDTIDDSDPTDSDTDGTETGDTGSTTEPFDCSQIPAVPVVAQFLEGFGNQEDFDFDADGYVVYVSNGSLVGRNLAGDFKVISSGVGAVAGTRVLATGDWLLADILGGALIRVDPLTGGQVVLGGGFSFPNGIDVTPSNEVFLSDFSAGNVWQGHAYKPDIDQIANNLAQANGVVLSEDEQMLFVIKSWEASVVGFTRQKDGSWAGPRELHNQPGGCFQGIAIDTCNQVYWTVHRGGQTDIMRKSPAGGPAEVVTTLDSSYVPNIHWGNGHGGWEQDVLYAADRSGFRLYAIPVGIPGSRHVLAP